jgi:hypothetical protein
VSKSANTRPREPFSYQVKNNAFLATVSRFAQILTESEYPKLAAVLSKHLAGSLTNLPVLRREIDKIAATLDEAHDVFLAHLARVINGTELASVEADAVLPEPRGWGLETLGFVYHSQHTPGWALYHVLPAPRGIPIVTLQFPKGAKRPGALFSDPIVVNIIVSTNPKEILWTGSAPYEADLPRILNEAKPVLEGVKVTAPKSGLF